MGDCVTQLAKSLEQQTSEIMGAVITFHSQDIPKRHDNKNIVDMYFETIVLALTYLLSKSRQKVKRNAFIF